MEVHWHIHQIERHYHSPDEFRFSLNSFIRSAKEVPGIILMELQNHPDFHQKIKPIIDRLLRDPLFRKVKNCRDFFVHRGMLETRSDGMVGTTEGKGFKFGIPFRLYPFESSEEAYERFKAVCREDREIRAFLGPDCDSYPCVFREWKIAHF